MVRFIQKLLSKILTKDTLAITTLVFLVCAISGPFGTFTDLTLSERLVFWAVSVFLGLVIGGACYESVWRWTSKSASTLRSLITSLTFSIGYTPVLIGIAGSSAIVEFPIRRPLIEIFGFVFISSLILCAYFLFTRANNRKSAPEELPRLYKRLTGFGDARVARLTVKDHYVHVCMDDGTEHRLLMRFADAVEEMYGVPGYCTHRSHWVSHAAVRKLAKRGAKEVLIMEGGVEVPISKTYRVNVVSAGFL